MNYPISQQTDETFLGSVTVNNNLTVSGNLQALNSSSTVSNANNVNVTGTSAAQVYYFPLVSSLSTGIKQLYVDSSSGFLYNPSSDFLLCNSFQANPQVSSNYYSGLSTVWQISLGSYTNPIQAYGLGTWNSTLSSIVPTFTVNTVSDSILCIFLSFKWNII